MTPEQERLVRECEHAAKSCENLDPLETKELCAIIREQDAWIKRAREIFQMDVENGYHDDRKDLLEEQPEGE